MQKLCDADPVLATRALRQWLTRDGYPPNAAAIQRVLGVARGRDRLRNRWRDPNCTKTSSVEDYYTGCRRGVG